MIYSPLISGNLLGTSWRTYFPTLMQTSMLQRNSGSLDSRRSNTITIDQISQSDKCHHFASTIAWDTTHYSVLTAREILEIPPDFTWNS